MISGSALERLIACRPIIAYLYPKEVAEARIELEILLLGLLLNARLLDVDKVYQGEPTRG